MKITPRQMVLSVFTLLVLGLGVGAYFFHWRRKNAVADYKRELLAAGEKLTVTELWPRPVPAEQNSVPILNKLAFGRSQQKRSLFETNEPPLMRMVKPGKAMVGWAQPDIREHSTNSWEEAEALLAQDDSSLQLIQQITQQPALDFQLDYRAGFNLMLPHLAPLKQATVRLAQASVCDLHRGNADRAALRVEAMLAIVKGSAAERLVISQLVRMAIAHITLTATWELLQSPNSTEAQLAKLQHDWAEVEFMQATEDALLMERAMSEATLAQMRNSSGAFRSVATGWRSGSGGSGSGDWFRQAGEMTLLKTKETLWHFAWSYPDQLRSLKGHQAILEAVRMVKNGQPFEVAFRQEEQKLAALGIEVRKEDSNFMIFDMNNMDLRSLFSQSVLSLQRLLHRVLAAEVARQMAVTAIALKRYHLSHGRYPSDLTTLTPEFVPAMPRDPVDGQPLRYRVQPDGNFLLYSIGEDGQDNVGDPSSIVKTKSPTWQKGRDWVWPQPATMEEVSAYYQEMAARESPATVMDPAANESFRKRYGLAAPTNSAATNLTK